MGTHFFMKLDWLEYDLQLKKPFGIAGNSRTFTPVVFVRLEKDGIAGYGEASLPPYLPETVQSVIAFLKQIDARRLEQATFDDAVEYLHSYPGNPSAKAALEIALADFHAKASGVPAYKLLHSGGTIPLNTFTIGLGELREIKEKLDDAESFRIIKVKLGSSRDKEIIREIRKHTDRPLCVDVNQGWPDREYALEMINWLYDQHVLLVEQPMMKEDISGHAWLSERSLIPVYADESFQNIKDLGKMKNAFSGINIKLMKCGGPVQASRIAEEARSSGLKILIGSMNESSCANLAAAHVADKADFTDLDGPFLISNNPFKDPVMQDGCIILSSLPGLGLEFTEAFRNFPKWQLS